MKVSRLWLMLSSVSTLLLGACVQRTPAPTATATLAPSPTPSPTSSATATASVTTTPPALDGKMACTMETALMPTPNATEQSLFPTVSDQDWVQGPPDAAVTFIEYSDFQ